MSIFQYIFVYSIKKFLSITDIVTQYIYMANRIREVAGGYQVLTTPHRKYDVGFEFMLGSWTDEGLLGFKILEFNNYADAECEALRHPDISWERLHEFHKDQYAKFGHIVTNVLDYSDITSNLFPHLMSPSEIKHVMMNRVSKAQQLMSIEDYELFDEATDTSFRLAYDMNDIISYTIVNPWTANLEQIQNLLMNETRLNLYKTHTSHGIIHLVGRTDIGSTYEIILCPSILYHFMLWKQDHHHCAAGRLTRELRKSVKLQKMIDRTEPIT